MSYGFRYRQHPAEERLDLGVKMFILHTFLIVRKY